MRFEIYFTSKLLNVPHSTFAYLPTNLSFWDKVLETADRHPLRPPLPSPAAIASFWRIAPAELLPPSLSFRPSKHDLELVRATFGYPLRA